MQIYAVARLRARDEAAVAVHVAVALRVGTAGLPKRRHLRERHGFFAEHNDLFIDLKPRYLVLLKENVARLPLLRGVENAVDVLGHGSQLLLGGTYGAAYITVRPWSASSKAASNTRHGPAASTKGWLHRPVRVAEVSTHMTASRRAE